MKLARRDGISNLASRIASACDLFVLSAAGGWMTVVGIWLVGAGINYLPLAIEAQRVPRPGVTR